MTVDQVLTALIASALSVLGAWAGVAFAFGKFRRERMWEARFAAYSEILSAIERIVAVNQHTVGLRHNEPARMPQDDYARGDKVARRVVQRHVDVSGLLLSEAFMTDLSNFNADLADMEHALFHQVKGEFEPRQIEIQTEHAVRVSQLAALHLRRLGALAKADIRTS